MTHKTEVRKYADADAVATAVAQAVVARLETVLEAQEVTHLAVTGGSVGILSLAKLGKLQSGVDWTRVHVWWGDERFVPNGSADRNSSQASAVWLDGSEVPAANIHEFPSSETGQPLGAAALEFAAELHRMKTDGYDHPVFDIVLLGMGPDGHVASLFPDSTTGELHGPWVLAEHDSPKPPPERLSFSFDLLNSAREVWFTVAGLDKAPAVTRVFEEANCGLPAAKVSGTEKTIWFVDSAAGISLEADN